MSSQKTRIRLNVNLHHYVSLESTFLHVENQHRATGTAAVIATL